MVSDNNSLDRFTVVQLTQLRQQTAELLQRLLVNREQSERRIAEMGKRDPLKTVTGRTAFDAAVVSTREMLEAIDRSLIAPHAELVSSVPQPEIVTFNLNGSIPGHRNGRPSVNGHPGRSTVRTRATEPVAAAST